MSDDDFQVRPGRIGSRGKVSRKSAQTLVGQIQRVAKRAGYPPTSQTISLAMRGGAG